MYVVHRQIVEDNVNDVRKAFADEGLDLKLCYSFKTNMMPLVTMLMEKLGVIPEVVSEYEYEAVQLKERLVVCNGVAMTYEQLADHVVHGDLVNFNDRRSIEEVVKIAGDKLKGKKVGLRVRFDDSSRFGVAVEDVRKVVNLIEAYGMELECLHCHVTGTRELSKYRQKVHDLVDVVLENSLTPKILDLGGSMYGIMEPDLAKQFDEVGSFEDYARIIHEELRRLPYVPSVMLELGTALIGNAVSIVANVIRIDEYNRIILDIDRYTIGQMLLKNVGYTHIPRELVKNAPRTAYKIYGASCIENDVILSNFEGHVEIGDKFEFFNCGAYTYCFEPDFIIPRQEVKIV